MGTVMDFSSRHSVGCLGKAIITSIIETEFKIWYSDLYAGMVANEKEFSLNYDLNTGLQVIGILVQ